MVMVPLVATDSTSTSARPGASPEPRDPRGEPLRRPLLTFPLVEVAEVLPERPDAFVGVELAPRRDGALAGGAVEGVPGELRPQRRDRRGRLVRLAGPLVPL